MLRDIAAAPGDGYSAATSHWPGGAPPPPQGGVLSWVRTSSMDPECAVDEVRTTRRAPVFGLERHQRVFLDRYDPMTGSLTNSASEAPTFGRWPACGTRAGPGANRERRGNRDRMGKTSNRRSRRHQGTIQNDAQCVVPARRCGVRSRPLSSSAPGMVIVLAGCPYGWRSPKYLGRGELEIASGALYQVGTFDGRQVVA